MDLDKIYQETQQAEAKIQAAIGEKTALTRQLEEQKKDYEQLEEECVKKLNCSLNELEAFELELQERVQEQFEELQEKIKDLD